MADNEIDSLHICQVSVFRAQLPKAQVLVQMAPFHQVSLIILKWV